MSKVYDSIVLGKTRINNSATTPYTITLPLSPIGLTTQVLNSGETKADLTSHISVIQEPGTYTLSNYTPGDVGYKKIGYARQIGYSSLSADNASIPDSMESIGTDLYVGSTTFGFLVPGILYLSKYDTIAKTWSLVGVDQPNGGIVGGMKSIGTDLYIGGLFTSVGVIANTAYIAKYNSLTNTWSSLSTDQPNGGVGFMEVIGTDLYVGGGFTSIGGISDTKYIAKYDTLLGTWSSLGTDQPDNVILSLRAVGTVLYVSGAFTVIGAIAFTGKMAKYDTIGGTWSSLSTNIMVGEAYSMVAVGTNLYVGGNFTSIGAIPNTRNIVKYDTVGGTWSSLSTDQTQGGHVTSLALIGTTLYLGGYFTSIEFKANTSYIARYDTVGGTYSALDTVTPVLSVEDMAVIGYKLYVGGTFASVGAIPDTSNFARYNPAIPATINYNASDSVSINAGDVLQFYSMTNEDGDKIWYVV